MASSLVLQVARRVAHSPLSKKLASRFSVKVVGDSLADYIFVQKMIGISVLEVSYDLTERAFERMLLKLKDLGVAYERRY